MTADLAAVQLLRARLGDITVLRIKENPMTETPYNETTPTPPGDDPWDGDDEPGGVAALSVGYPELPANPHNHIYTWSPKLPDGSMLVIRANTAQGLVDSVEAVAPLAGRLRAAWQGVVGGGTPQQAPMVPPQGQPNYNPQLPPPNQPFPGQPAWQTAGAQPQAPQQNWGGAPQGGGQQQGQQRQQYPAPGGWYKLNVPFPGGKDQLHALAQGAGIPKGNPAKGGAYNFYGLTPGGQPGKAWYCSPQAAPAFAQFNPMPA